MHMRSFISTELFKQSSKKVKLRFLRREAEIIYEKKETKQEKCNHYLNKSGHWTVMLLLYQKKLVMLVHL